MSWRLAGALVALVDEVLDQHPGTTVWSIGDAAHASRASDHNPSPGGVVCAVDIVGPRVAGEVWDRLLELRDPRMKYMILRGRIVNSTVKPWQVRAFGGHPHDQHIHVSVGRGPDGSGGRPDLYDDRQPWHLYRHARLPVDAIILLHPTEGTPDALAGLTALFGRPDQPVGLTVNVGVAKQALREGRRVYAIGGPAARLVQGDRDLSGATRLDTQAKVLEQSRRGW